MFYEEHWTLFISMFAAVCAAGCGIIYAALTYAERRDAEDLERRVDPDY
jgi:hypothetical protein